VHPATARLATRIAAFVLAVAGPMLATDFYVAPNGSPSGDGSINSPWDLQTALNQPSAVQPGDTIWMRGGTYVGHYQSFLNGTSASPIIVRQYAGERATLDGHDGTANITLDIDYGSSYAWFWGFEVMNSNPNRTSGNTSPPPNYGEGVHLIGPGTKLINMVIHDTAQGELTTAETNESYGNLIYYNGWDGSDRGHGHGIYLQHQGTTPKPVFDNIIFEQHGYGIHGYTTNGNLDYLDVEGNTSFDNGGISTYGWTTNILIGGLQVANSPTIANNATYNQDLDGMNNLGYSAGCNNATISGNYFDSGTALTVINCTGVSMTNNTFYGSISGFTQSQFPNNTYYSSQPTGTKIFLRPNTYEAGRASITIFNWDLQSSVAVDLSSQLSVGSYYEVRDAQNYFAGPVFTGTYDGNPVSFPMTGLAPATPIGNAAPPPTGPRFNVFILTSTLGPYEFYDVPQSSPFHSAIHTIAANGITAGCGGGDFCPDASVSRAQMAVFLLKAEHGSSYLPPPATGAVFGDVPASAFAASWIEQLFAEGISSGCGGGNFCSAAPVTRAQMAVFLLKASQAPGYVPPPASGTVFADVPISSFAAAWIEDLSARGITAGCGGGDYCPSSFSTRAQMAVFLVRAFGLS
jgi:hypothetical protein